MRARASRRRAVAAVSVVLAAALALAGCSADRSVSIDTPDQLDTPLSDSVTQQLQEAVTSAMAAAGASGAIVDVSAPWSGTYTAALGTQGPDGGPTDTADEFRAGSVTRAMTCDLLYAMVQRGAVSLSDPISKWVSGVPDRTDVTLGQLCDGTSGIGSYAPQLSSLWIGNPSRVWNPRELAAYGLGQGLSGTPGAAYTGSDAGYVLLGLAMERAGGKSVSDLLAENVFDPLDLNATSLPDPAPAAPAGGADALKGFLSQRDAAGAMNCAQPRDMTVMSSSIGYTDSGVTTDIHDLARYARALASGALLPEGVNRFADPLPAAPGAPSWFTARGGAFQAGSLIGQYGSFPGYLTAAFADPTTGLTVAVVLNNSAVDPGAVANLAWELAAIASKAPAAAGKTAPQSGLPWTAQQMHDAIAAAAVCPAPAQ